MTAPRFRDLPAASARISLPTPPQVRPRREFPVIASAAPVVGSLVMWVVTGSVFTLFFAALGPVIGVASLVDDRRVARRFAKAEKARFARGVQAAEAAIETAQAREREQLSRLALRPGDLVQSAARDPEWWRHDGDSAVLVCLGLGTIASATELGSVIAATTDAATADGETAAAPAVASAYERLRSKAGRLQDAPVLVDARNGIGIVGAGVPARALARAVVAQLSFRLSPADTAVFLDDGGCFGWANRLPYPRAGGGHPDRIEFRAQNADGSRRAPVLCAVASDAADLPRDCRIVIRLDGCGTAVIDRDPTGAVVSHLRPWFVSEAQAAALAATASAYAQADGLVPAGESLPDVIRFAELEATAAAPDRLPAIFGRTGAGPLLVDLVTDGPHAVVGGTTGSGKSELLISWVLALARSVPPGDVNFLLVDFKGGSSFAAVSCLPHTVGLITDLDAAGAHRALTSLRAELRHRERILAGTGARSVDELAGEQRMPRLVIVVDEFAVVAEEFPALQVLFADLAARGRSLGIHLVLCTQRPAGVIRDSVLANCSIRLSLRVNNAADSTAVIGSAVAAELPQTAHGRCYLSVGGSEPVGAQVALATADDVAAVTAQWPSAAQRARRPWLDPLPDVVLREHLPAPTGGPGWVFGMSDVPEEQDQPVAAYVPQRDGNLLVLGGHGSGKTGVLAVLQAAVDDDPQSRRVECIPDDIEGAWDAVVAAVAQLGRTAPTPTIYLLDDVDALLGRLPEEYQLRFVDQLARLLRDGPGLGRRLVLTAARLSSGIQSLLTLCDSRLLLRLPSRQEHLIAGGEGEQYVAQLPPGGGFWHGHRVQVAVAPPLKLPQTPGATWTIPSGTAFTVVAPDARGVALRLLAGQSGRPPILDIGAGRAQGAGLGITAGDVPGILVGSPLDWQAEWSLLAAARARGPLVFAGCSVGEFRSISGSRTVPPPISVANDRAWLLGTDGAVRRIVLPSH